MTRTDPFIILCLYSSSLCWESLQSFLNTVLIQIINVSWHRGMGRTFMEAVTVFSATGGSIFVGQVILHSVFTPTFLTRD